MVLFSIKCRENKINAITSYDQPQQKKQTVEWASQDT